ncbi:MAG: GntR family transcriptional regulator [Rhodobacteraceae bacterium]|nr:GntR family transcriptional regulator [Paracoccaceae bacterium]
MCRLPARSTWTVLHTMALMSAQKQPTTKANLPAHEVVYRKIRDKVLYGKLKPGQAVTIQGLVEELNVSMTPVREAIRRLTAEGALINQGNRRVSVPQMDAERFAELVFARKAIEPELARIAAQKSSNEAILHLTEIDQRINVAMDAGDVSGYMLENHQFHFTLYAQAGSAILLPLAETLWLRYGPLYRIICGKYGTGNMVDMHEETLQALANRDGDATARAILKDIEQGFEIVRADYGWSQI